MTDYLTCGECLKEFPLQKITLFIQHKKVDCDDEGYEISKDSELQCNYCPQGFMTAWGLLIHAQISHNLKIFLEKASRSFLQGNKLFLKAVAENPSISPHSRTDYSLQLQTELRGIEAASNDGSGAVQVTALTAGVQQQKKEGTFNNVPTACLRDTASKFGPGIIVSQESLPSAMETQIIEASISNNQRLASGGKSPSSQTDVGKLLTVPYCGKASQQEQGRVTHSSQCGTDNSPFTCSTNISPCGLHNTPCNTDRSPFGTDQSPCGTGSSPCGTACPSSGTDHSSCGTDKTPCSTDRSSCGTSSSPCGTACPPSGTDHSPCGADSSPCVPHGELSVPHEENTDILPEANGVSAMDVDVEKGINDESAAMDDALACCDNQGCGVTVIPGTHQDLQKCCNAVVPKKRKRHFEMKHMSYSWSSSRYARRKMLNRSVSGMKAMSSSLAKTSSIFIEVEPDSSSSDKPTCDNYNCTGMTSVGNVTVTTDPSMSFAGTSTTRVQTLTQADMKPKSLILQPGAIFSIPFTYTIPVSSGMSTFRFNTPVTTVTSSTRSRGTPVSTSGEGKGDAQGDDSASQSGAAGINPQMTFAVGAVRGQRSFKNGDRSTKYSTSKPFHCEICSMTFNQRIHLKKHIMSKHTGNKPYKCGECDYSTVERSHLKVHIRIHTGEKPFKCTYCEYATAQNSTLKIHLKRHHGGKMFHCGACEKEFTQEQQLKGHECEHVVDSSPEKKNDTQASASAITQTGSLPVPFADGPLSMPDLQSTSTAMGDNFTSPEVVQVRQSSPDSRETILQAPDVPSLQIGNY